MPATTDVEKKRQELQRLQEIERQQLTALKTKSGGSKTKVSQKSPAARKSKASTNARKSPRVSVGSTSSSSTTTKKKSETKPAARRTKSKDKTLKEPQHVMSDDPFGVVLGEQSQPHNLPSETLIDFHDDCNSYNSSAFNNNFKDPLSTNPFAKNPFSSELQDQSCVDLVSIHEDVIYEEDENNNNQQQQPQEFQFPDGNISPDDEFPENESESELFRNDANDEYFEENDNDQSEKYAEDQFNETEDQSNSEFEDEFQNNNEEGMRNKIFQEIEETKFREMELQRAQGEQYQQTHHGDILLPKSHNKMHHFKSDEEFIICRKTSEEESGYYNDDVEDDVEDELSDDSIYVQENERDLCSPAERIRREMEAQNDREQELNNIHRSLSEENLYDYNSPTPHEESEEEISIYNESVDTRTKIFEEMDLLKQREKELRKKRFYTNSQQYSEDDETDEAPEEEVDESAAQISVIDQIKQEMFDLQHREEELLRQRPRYNSYESSNTDQPGNVMLSKQPVFGSREDLVAFFGTTNESENSKTETKSKGKKTPRSQHSVKIPKAFRQQLQDDTATGQKVEAAKRQHPQGQQPTTNNKTMPTQNKQQIIARGKQKEKNNISKKDERKKQFNKKKTDKQGHENQGEVPQINIQPIARKWEKRSEEERIRREQIDKEIQKKREEYLQLVQQKVDNDHHQRLLQHEKIKELQQKERQRQILKQKKQGLNELWLSQKAVVTVDDNPDYHDEHLLNTSTEKIIIPSEKEMKQTTKLDNHLKISKTIRRWEKRIAKQTTE